MCSTNLSRIKDSIILQIIDVILTGRCLSAIPFSPFLWIAVMHALNHSEGRFLSLRDFWNRVDRGNKIRSAIALRNRGCHWSGPGVFPGFKFVSFIQNCLKCDDEVVEVIAQISVGVIQ